MDAPSISVAGAMDFAGAEPVSTAWGLDSDPGAGLAGGGDGRDMSWSDGGAPPRGPEQWDEEKVVDFIQVWDITCHACARQIPIVSHSIFRGKLAYSSRHTLSC